MYTLQNIRQYFNVNFEVQSKSYGKIQPFIGWLLSFLHITQGYLTNFITTIGNTFYIPSRWMPNILSNSIGTDYLGTLLHEVKHLYQAQAEGKLKFHFKYLCSKKARLAYELDAYKISILTYVFFYGSRGRDDLVGDIYKTLKENYSLASVMTLDHFYELYDFYNLILEIKSGSISYIQTLPQDKQIFWEYLLDTSAH